ncbi:MAG TPA: hypothetical protein VKO18_04665 [Terriglobia bacterium]|nr:hypothetical protein [Terriglobia bacterium]
MGQTIEIPVDLYNKWLRAGEALDDWRDAFEDFLIVNNSSLLRRLRKARQEHLSGKARSWEEFKRDSANSRKRARQTLIFLLSVLPGLEIHLV